MWKPGNVALAVGCTLLLTLTIAAPLRAEVVQLEILSREPMANGFELIRGRIHGEIDPKDPHNAIIQDIVLAPRNARGNVEYVATFALAKPIDLTNSPRVLLYQVVNRGNGQAVASPDGYISLVSGWQGDVIPTANNQTIVVPIARRAGGAPVTGPVLARFSDLKDGARSAPIHLASLGTAQPYPPVDLAQPGARLSWHTRETYSGERDEAHPVARNGWAFANCETRPWPGEPDPTRICLRGGFQPELLYQLTYTAKDPLVLGSGWQRRATWCRTCDTKRARRIRWRGW